MSEQQKKQKVHAIVLSGNHRYRKEKLSKILNSFDEYSISYMDVEYNIEDLYREVSQSTCFSDNRVIIIRELPKNKVSKQKTISSLIDVCDKIPDDCYLIFDNVNGLTDKFIKHVKSIGKVLEDDQYVKFWEASKWIMNVFKDKGVDVDKSVAEIIADSVGVTENSRNGIDIDKLYLTIDKICHYIGNRKTVKKEDVQSCCEDSSDFIIWQFFDYLDSKSYEEAISVIEKALNQESNVSSAMHRIFNVMLWRYSMLVFLKEDLAKKQDVNQVYEDNKQLCKITREGNLDHTQYYHLTNKKGEKTLRFSPGAAKMSLEKSRKGKAPVECYSRKELMQIKEKLFGLVSKDRIGACDQEVLSVFCCFVAAICRKFPINNIENLLRVSDGRYA